MREEGADTKAGGTGMMTAGIVIVAVIAAGAYLGFGPDTAPDEEDLATIVAEDASVPARDASEPGAVAVVSPDETVEETPAAEPPVAPSIDEVRLEGDGLTVIAGRAEPGAQVSVLVDGRQVATVTADAGGAFAAVALVDPSDEARVLTLQAESDGASVASAEEVILAPVPTQTAQADPSPDPEAETSSSKPEEVVAADAAPVETDPSTNTATEAATTNALPAPGAAERDTVVTADVTTEAPRPAATTALAESADPAEAPRSEETAVLSPDTSQTSPVPEPQAAEDASSDGARAPTQPDVETAAVDTPAQPSPAPIARAETDQAALAAPSQSIAVLKSTEEGVELLQSQPQVLSSIAIDTIGYSDAGDVQLSGRAAAGTSEVRVYLNNRFVGGLPVDEKGVWRGDVPDVDAGIYQLRVDEVNEAGDVTSRLETPFKREAPAVLAEASAGQEGPVRAVTVQTGDTLWAIARDRYGEGLLYVRVFEANRRDIRDPDLIYPGQVFDLPVP
ncbi:LysM peptidoglycan-binding domain-containing protein [Roseobacter sp.]|uniref:LysM peptidoglycan-binding domain-containing protein n=1 Tax=Roseobacter sp. TaxID=1907202 RepID=UPI002965EF30|nr:LysM peptidoglycan-binding domain-containing protein [Roseobacter sp.]MDW3183846.1 LysM peptidoglycan-binding domain-containing protein [Roseobacter sp.]